METKILIISILALSLVSCRNESSNSRKTPLSPPNIIIVSADDLAYNSLGAFGCRVRDISPNIDRIAEEGMRFTHAHVNTAVCQPCRQSWLTGRFPHNNGAEGFEPIAEDVPTLPEQLQRVGYLNGILGKEIHHQPVKDSAGILCHSEPKPIPYGDPEVHAIHRCSMSIL